MSQKFPETPMSPTVELYYDSLWNPIDHDDIGGDGISITRGRRDEGQVVDPGSMTLSLRNATGKYSPRNPNSTLYGKIAKGTPIRCYVEMGQVYGQPSSGGTNIATTPDAAAIDVTGDIDLRVAMTAESWRPEGSGWIGPLKDSAYGLLLGEDGYLTLSWSTSSITSDVPVPGPSVGYKNLRVTLDVNNGAGGHTATFYQWDGSTWDAWSTVTDTGTVSIPNSANALRIVAWNSLGNCRVNSCEVRNGIGGTLVANPIFTSQTSGVTSFVDSRGRTWTVVGNVWNRHYRFWGEVVNWPQRWDRSGSKTSEVPIECAGILRRLGQGGENVKSPMYRAMTGLNPKAMWPFEDGRDANRITAAVGPSGYVRSAGEYGAYSEFVGTQPIATGGSYTLRVPPHTQTGYSQILVMCHLGTAIPDGLPLMRAFTTSSLGWYDLIYTTASGGGLHLEGFTKDNVLAVTTDTLTTLDDRKLWLSIEATQVSTQVKLRLAFIEEGDSIGYFFENTTGGANTLGSVSSVLVNPLAVTAADASFGHLAVFDVINSIFVASNALNAYNGETPDDRIYRLCSENDVVLNIQGQTDLQLGYQPLGELLPLLRDSAVDGGVLYESRHSSSLTYRSLDALTNQDPFAFDYQDNLLRPFEPEDDDQNTKNVVTVTRSGGGSATIRDTSGPLGTTAIGIYADDSTVSLYVDEMTTQVASWRLNLGTVNEARWPSLGFYLEDSPWQSSATDTRSILSLDIGDTIRVSDLPEWLPPLDAWVVIWGMRERITPDSYGIEFMCSPASPYETVVYDDGVSRWDNQTSTLASSATSTATSLSVATASPPLWTHADGDFDITVGGEVMTVTNVTGASSPQTFTVTRSVNGVVKAQTSGTSVGLADDSKWAL